ncbi:hypothetical protein RB195_010828 [Necator americanus]|uniref:Uncharacterized protein n=1 Tax=Necator americanus TaxID=51031 RepID=A0ABR1CZM3_NECAM
MRVLADDKSLEKSVARYGDADLEVDNRRNAKRQSIERYCTLGVVPITEKMKEARLSWFGHVSRKEENSIAKTALKLHVSGARPRGTPRMRWLDLVKLDMIDPCFCAGEAMDGTE